MRLNQVDLNLFVVFDAVYSERNLTRAAERLRVTQPAVSNALGRLRAALDDPLFVRTPGGMRPTALADNIVGQVRQALGLLDLGTRKTAPFRPDTSARVFRLSMNDLAEAVLLPELQAGLQAEAPGIGVESYYVPRRDLTAELASGRLDLAIDVPSLATASATRAPLPPQHYVCMLRPDHPAARTPLTLERYLDLGHVHVSSRRRGAGHADIALSRLGAERDIRLRVQHYLVAPLIVATTDLALTAPAALARGHELAILDLPFAVEPLDWQIYWHPSADREPANAWLRERLLGAM